MSKQRNEQLRQGRSGREQHDTIEDHLIARGKAKKEYMEEQRLLHSQEQLNSYPFQPQISETARSLQRTEPVEVRMAKEHERVLQKKEMQRVQREQEAAMVSYIYFLTTKHLKKYNKIDKKTSSNN